jgi:hypothetical protein
MTTIGKLAKAAILATPSPYLPHAWAASEDFSRRFP